MTVTLNQMLLNMESGVMGSFAQNLKATWDRADSSNRERMKACWPQLFGLPDEPEKPSGHKFYIARIDQPVWERTTISVEVPDEVIAQGAEAIREFIRDAYGDGNYQETKQARYLCDVEQLGTQITAEPETPGDGPDVD